MFVREKHINGYAYLYLVESVREDGRTKQRIIKNLGRKEVVVASGELERLAASVARYAERAIVLSQLVAGNPDGLACKRIRAPRLFGRLWEETSCRTVLEELLATRDFEFPVERAVFVSVLHRIMVSGTTVRLIAEQIQLVIVHDAFRTVGCLKDYRFYRGFFKHRHRKHLHQCVE